MASSKRVTALTLLLGLAVLAGGSTVHATDECPDDPAKTAPGICGCGVPDDDSDGDGVPDCIDGCPGDIIKTEPGVCGCGEPDTDEDGDGIADCLQDPCRIDEDRDGWPLCSDCDDNDPAVYPYALELLDGKDNDCNFQADEPWGQISCRLFYNNSYYDGNHVGIDPGTGAKTDSAAIDPYMLPLQSGGGMAAVGHWSRYTKGINGLIYDVYVGPTSRDPQIADLVFTNIGKEGISSTLVGPSASSMIVLDAGSPTTMRKFRMIFTFADNSLKNTWLQVDVGAGFGAPAETHYWGNAAGDAQSDVSGKNILVNAQDELMIRAHPTTALNRSPVYDLCDVNKDSLANASDQLYVRANITSALNCVKKIIK